MAEESAIVNKVAQSGLITLKLDELIPIPEFKSIDVKDYLFREMILKEKDFRDTLKDKDWAEYKDQHVAVFCSADAIVPNWAYMLLASYLQPVTNHIYFGTPDEAIQTIVREKINDFDIEKFRDQKIVVKGCSDTSIHPAAYFEITRKLRPVVKSIMYGEPCSTVPVFKLKPRKKSS